MSNCSRFSVFSGADLMFDIRVVLGDTRVADHCSKGRFLRGRRASFVVRCNCGTGLSSHGILREFVITSLV
jgi:hypothetical protein